MATKKMDILIKIHEDSMFPIRIWVDNPAKQLEEIESVEGVTNTFCIPGGSILVTIDPRYDVQEVADELKELLTATVPDVFRD